MDKDRKYKDPVEMRWRCSVLLGSTVLKLLKVFECVRITAMRPTGRITSRITIWRCPCATVSAEYFGVDL